MRKITVTEAFAHYGAKLKNVRWTYSAIAKDGSLVLSCWQRYLTSQPDRVLRYEVNEFSRWTSNPLGKSLLQNHLRQALQGKLPVRMVLAATTDAKAPLAGEDGSKVQKTFQVRGDLVGRVVELTSARFIIDFREVKAPSSNGTADDRRDVHYQGVVAKLSPIGGSELRRFGGGRSFINS